MHTDHFQDEARRRLVTQDTQEVIKLCLIGLAGELGEVADPLKKYLYQGHALDSDHLEDEIGDLLWYLANLCNALGLSLNTAMERNCVKLAQRYPDGFSSEASRNREEGT